MRYAINAANGSFSSNDHYLDTTDPLGGYDREDQHEDMYVSVIDQMFSTEVSEETRRLGATTDDGSEIAGDVWYLADRINVSYNETLTNSLALRSLNVFTGDDLRMRVGSMIVTIGTFGASKHADCVKCKASSTLSDDMLYGDLSYDLPFMQAFTAWVISHGNNHSAQYAGKGANRTKVDRYIIGSPISA